MQPKTLIYVLSTLHVSATAGHHQVYLLKPVTLLSCIFYNYVNYATGCSNITYINEIYNSENRCFHVKNHPSTTGTL
jgi:hypothetical protein